jgi:hypothetical protein
MSESIRDAALAVLRQVHAAPDQSLSKTKADGHFIAIGL